MTKLHLSAFHVIEPDGLAQLIRRRRQELHMTTRDVAVAAGLNHSTVSYLELGVTANPAILTMFGLCVALKVPFEEICRAALVDAKARQNLANNAKKEGNHR
jgi:transcriptional regulator with XRE-family HTH domain